MSASESIGLSAQVDASAVIVDALAYYRAFYRAASRARRSILLAGWQFDTDAVLLRGADASEATLPVALLPFLAALAEREPELRICVLAWDYSPVYAFEREWLQDWKFALDAPKRVRFEFETHPRPTGSHHQKFVVIDDSVAFAGGMDICDERWDDRNHLLENPLRTKATGERYPPNHEVQALVTGEAARVLGDMFRERWLATTGEKLEAVRARPDMAAELVRENAGTGGWLSLDAPRVRICRTSVFADGRVEREILRAFEAALASAERLVYIETQYFTSRSFTKALLDRLCAAEKSKLEIIVVLPKRADSSKEGFALGETQGMVLGALERAARERGHEIRFLCSLVDESSSEATFVHSKVLVVDDAFLCVGSANLTERSMGFDSELSLIWEAMGSPSLERDIRNVRASLLAEHANREPHHFDKPSGIVGAIDAFLSSASSRLRVCPYEPCEPNVLKSRIFDPGGPDVVGDLEAETRGFDEPERFARGSGRIMRELSERLLSRSKTTARRSDG